MSPRAARWLALTGTVLWLAPLLRGAAPPSKKSGKRWFSRGSVRAAPEKEPSFRGYRIARIYVIRRQIFDVSIPSENKMGYRAVNHLHITTQERTVREQLLFNEGDLFNPELARETERALRQILRLRDVRVKAVPVGGGRVDVLVESQDTWSTEILLSMSGTGSETNYLLGARERNALGLGKKVGFLYKKDTDLISRTFSYDDPALLGTRLRLAGNYQDTADGSSRFLSLERPFYSSLTRYSVKTQGSYDKSDTIVYQDGKEVDRYTQENRKLGGGVGFSLGSTTRRIRRLGLGYSYQHNRLDAAGSAATAGQDDVYHLIGPSMEWQQVDFITEDHIRQYTREEDFNLGFSLKGNVGVSQSRWVPGAANATMPQGTLTQGRLWGPGNLGLVTFQGNGRYENGWQDTETKIDLEYYNHFLPWSTWAGHLAWDQVLHPAEDTQLLLGGDTGLRGYPVNQFAGNRLFLANLENRLFFVPEVLNFFGVGAVVFGDAGYAWPRGQAVRFEDLRADYGAGLRIHLTRASLGQVLRLDLAWPTRANNGNRSPVWTFGTSQVF
ncbi:MAG: BamA/TamA family outer membrane protein [Elusimicrobia bacterium]|nr:BamA/TamA family outer membrane protein [Elusimicrobiota bacterium]